MLFDQRPVLLHMFESHPETDRPLTDLVHQPECHASNTAPESTKVHPLGETNNPDDEHRQTKIGPRRRHRLATPSRCAAARISRGPSTGMSPASALPKFILLAVGSSTLVGAEQQLKQTLVSHRLHVRQVSSTVVYQGIY